jgi:hypothetical protein
MRSLGSVSFVPEASVPAQRNLYGEKERIQCSGFLICFWRTKDGELFANFFYGNEMETTFDEEKQPDYEKARFGAGSTHSFVMGRQRNKSALPFFFFFFFFWGKILDWGIVGLGSWFWCSACERSHKDRRFWAQ